jgi:hypothetical protein
LGDAADERRSKTNSLRPTTGRKDPPSCAGTWSRASGSASSNRCGEQDADASDEQAAWCDQCEEARLAGGGWTAKSEAEAGITLICAVCFEESRARNSRWTAVSRRWGPFLNLGRVRPRAEPQGWE